MRAQLWERMLFRSHILIDLACREIFCVEQKQPLCQSDDDVEGIGEVLGGGGGFCKS